MISILRNTPTPTCANYPTPTPPLRGEGSSWMEVITPPLPLPCEGRGVVCSRFYPHTRGGGLFIRDKCSRRDLSGRC